MQRAQAAQPPLPQPVDWQTRAACEEQVDGILELIEKQQAAGREVVPVLPVRRNEELAQLVGEITTLQAEATNFQSALNQFKLEVETAFTSNPAARPLPYAVKVSREHTAPEVAGLLAQATWLAPAASQRHGEPQAAAAAAGMRRGGERRRQQLGRL